MWNTVPKAFGTVPDTCCWSEHLSAHPHGNGEAGKTIEIAGLCREVLGDRAVHLSVHSQQSAWHTEGI